MAARPVRKNTFVPVEPVVPMARKAAAPSRKIQGMAASVSALLRMVGWSNRPCCVLWTV